VVSTAVNIPSIAAEDMAVLRPFLPLASQLGRLAIGLAEGSSLERVEVAFFGRIGDYDTRLLTSAVLQGALRGHTEEAVNFVNAPSLAAERGIVVEERMVSASEDFNELIRVSVVAGGERVAVAGTGMGPQQVPHLVEVWGQRFTIELEPNLTVFRYRDLPGMIGRVGTVLGAHAINISSAAVGRQPAGAADATLPSDLAAMVVTTREPVPDEVLGEILAAEGWVSGRSVVL
jgi:D-3-phosphoglycerate dehydrogenase